MILNIFIWLIDGTLIDTPTPGQGGPEGNGNESMLYTARLSDTVLCHIKDTPFDEEQLCYGYS